MTGQRYCPPPGLLLPPPNNAQPFTPTIKLETTLKSNLWFNETTIAIKASIGGTPAFEYAHQPGSKQISNLHDTKFRIASATKLFTVLAVLLSRAQIGWEDSITQFVPGLNDASYNDVTIGALAGQTSGLGRFGYVGDLSLTPGFSTAQLGLPNSARQLPGCDAFPGGKPCSRDQVIAMFNDAAYAPTSPNSGPLYSNIAYNLLGMALEQVHSQSYEQAIQELIFDPIGMRNSSFDTPSNGSDAILPQAGDQWFAAPFGNFNPSGGIWSTPNDMLLFLEALQTHKLLSPAQTRKWLQPSSLLPSLQQLLGAPWEIFRPTDIDVAVPRPIDLYTKAGGVSGYSSHEVLVPEYGVALTIHAAGKYATMAVQNILPLVAKPLIAHADEQARAQATTKYVGTYRSAEGNSSITLALDDGPGLKIERAFMNGVAIIPALAAVQGVNPSDASARLYPTGADSQGSEKESWSIFINRMKIGEGRAFAELDCASWNWGDAARYAGQPLDRIVFDMSQGKAVGVELVGWRTVLKKVE
ncbi:beta-lactamase/transpeptidase-like protein [Bimuria novae-zelandiae CBS 107.79]|uniref:Beta-lactamase/transpeptidase-like protein n=1 Tax=Bimuria novae-zelandiae CBS 107.79 TaxID=1447943 RepID=A0A6A5UMY0_9PLEO|nr:beta-lactamase/transpeptidase-like protein [Bimuria novae-zelandiae CBS 107.79]